MVALGGEGIGLGHEMDGHVAWTAGARGAWASDCVCVVTAVVLSRCRVFVVCGGMGDQRCVSV